MGLFGTIWRGVKGAATGFIGSGFNPLGAAAGAGVGLLSGGGGGKRRDAGTRADQYAEKVGALAPRLEEMSKAYAGGLTAPGEAYKRFAEFDPMQGYEEELSARTRPLLQGVRESAVRGGRFRGGYAQQQESRAVTETAAQMLSERQRAALAAMGGQAQAAGSLADRYYGATVGAPSQLYSGLADYYQRFENAERDRRTQMAGGMMGLAGQLGTAAATYFGRRGGGG